MPLKLNVKPGEKFIVNGAVMVAGKKGASLVLQNDATILLGKDIIQERCTWVGNIPLLTRQN